MDMGERLRRLREARKLSQGDIEKRTGLLRCYISRVENGHTIPAVETLEKLARALEVPIYQLFYKEADDSSQPLRDDKSKFRHDWASRGRGRRLFSRLQRTLSKASDRDRALLLSIAAKMAANRKR